MSMLAGANPDGSMYVVSHFAWSLRLMTLGLKRKFAERTEGRGPMFLTMEIV